MFSYTGTKPKVKRVLFKSSEEIAESIPFANDLPPVDTQSDISPEQHAHSCNTSISLHTTPVSIPKSIAIPRPTRSNRDYKLIPFVDNPESILRKPKRTTTKSDSFNFFPSPSSLLKGIKSIFPVSKPQIKIRNSLIETLPILPTGLSSPIQHSIENTRPSPAHSTPIQTRIQSNGNNALKSDPSPLDKSNKIETVPPIESYQHPADSDTVERHSGIQGSNLTKSTLSLRNSGTDNQSRSDHLLIRPTETQTQQTSTFLGSRDRTIVFPSQSKRSETLPKSPVARQSRSDNTSRSVSRGNSLNKFVKRFSFHSRSKSLDESPRSIWLKSPLRSNKRNRSADFSNHSKPIEKQTENDHKRSTGKLSLSLSKDTRTPLSPKANKSPAKQVDSTNYNTPMGAEQSSPHATINSNKNQTFFTPTPNTDQTKQTPLSPKQSRQVSLSDFKQSQSTRQPQVNSNTLPSNGKPTVNERSVEANRNTQQSQHRCSSPNRIAAQDSNMESIQEQQHHLANSMSPFSDLSDFHKGQRALTMLIQLPSFSGSPMTRFERWIKLFENVVSMSNWNNEEKINMLVTKMTDKAHDILQNMLECHTQDYNEIIRLLFKRFHGNETEDYYQKKFENSERKPQESILDFAFRLKTLFQRGYPSSGLDENESDEKTRLLFLRQKFLQGLEPSLRNKVRYKTTKSFEELVNEAHKYSIRMEADKDEKDKREFVSAVSKTNDSSPEIKQLINAIEKQNETINAIAGKFSYENKTQHNFQKEADNTSSSEIDLLAKAVANKLGLQTSNRPFNSQLNGRKQQQPLNRHHTNDRQQSANFYNKKSYQPNNSNRPNRPNQTNIVCNHCNIPGHLLQNCFKYQREILESARPPICYSCKNIGHISTACPNKNSPSNRPNLPSSSRNQGNE